MRFTLQEAADGFKSNALKMQAAADEGDVVFDSSGRVSLMMAQSLARFVSREFSELFGANAQLPGRDVISMKATGDIHRIATPAGISLLEPDFCGYSRVALVTTRLKTGTKFTEFMRCLKTRNCDVPFS